MDSFITDHNNHNLAASLSQELSVRYSLSVSPTWLTEFLANVRHPLPPLPALASTANFRLLNSDFTKSLSHASSTNTPQQPSILPHGVSDVNVKQTQLQTNVPVQLLDILDVGSSRWSQIQAIERFERGEEVRGREIIRNVTVMNDENEGPVNASGGNSTAGQGVTKKSGGPHKLLLQDAAGTLIWGFELLAVPRMFITTSVDGGGLQIGTKVLLKKDIIVRRGMVMLEPGSVTVMGGKVEEWDKKWRMNRKQRLLDEIQKEHEQQDPADT